MPIQTVSQALDNEGRGSPYGYRNRITNGAMMVDQRNYGNSITGTDGVYGVDRWRFETTQSSKATIGQNLGNVAPPVGFSKYLGVSSSSSYSLLASDRFNIGQWIEGYNCADFDMGSTNAKTFTISFWVRSSLTGTFGGACLGYDGTNFRNYTWSYTINQSNTWEYKTITVVGDTTSFNYSKTNSWGIFLTFSLGHGSDWTSAAGTWGSGLKYAPTTHTSVVGTNGATWYVTGIQVERGTQATSYDYRSFSQELNMCQRYYQQLDSTTAPYSINGSVGGTDHIFGIFLPVQMRSAPTVNFSGGFTSYYFSSINGSQLSISITSVAVNSSIGGFRFYHGRQGATGTACWADFGGTNAKFTINSEL